jgi:hypothetical protein
MVFYRLDHYPVLRRWRRHLHATRAANCRMRNVSIAGNLVRCIDHDDAPVQIVREHTGNLAQHGGFANTRAAEQEQAFARLDQVPNDGDGAVDGTANTTSQADDFAAPIADRGDSMKRALDTGPVVITELANTRRHIFELFAGDIFVTDVVFSILEAGFGFPAKIHNDLYQASTGTIGGEIADSIVDTPRQDIQEIVQVVRDFVFRNGVFLEFHFWF